MVYAFKVFYLIDISFPILRQSIAILNSIIPIQLLLFQLLQQRNCILVDCIVKVKLSLSWKSKKSLIMISQYWKNVSKIIFPSNKPLEEFLLAFLMCAKNYLHRSFICMKWGAKSQISVFYFSGIDISYQFTIFLNISFKSFQLKSFYKQKNIILENNIL